MLKIKAAQSERDRLSMLLAKNVDDISLVEKLTFVFNHPNSTEHYLFENVLEINEEGIRNILSFYETSKLYFQEVLEEDIYKTKPRTSKHHI
ncbi:821_t:CDS:2 [Scutellospora calospora]|uniref:821_t:CDS:1 n=1 Tax=Scutellospora calospora TaxID=85575 RepID=A0ACA9L452_9GLOM|nr:821_t:CDS:2 [Scutellospora calospora]